MNSGSQPTQPLREQWGVFELEPGLRLWVRVMLPFVTSQAGPPKSDQFRMATIIVTEASEEFKGAPATSPTDFLNAVPSKSYDHVKEIAPCESLYQLPNGLLVSMKMHPIRARRYADHAADRDPIIQLDNEIQVLTIPQPGSPQPTGFAFGQPPQPLPPASEPIQGRQ